MVVWRRSKVIWESLKVLVKQTVSSTGNVEVRGGRNIAMEEDGRSY